MYYHTNTLKQYAKMEQKGMVAIEEISFRYKRKGNGIFNNFSLNLQEGQIYGLLGRNGSGKSTLLYLISGLLHTKSGKILFKGSDVSRREPAMLSDVFIVPEEFELPKVSLMEYIKLYSRFYPNFSFEILDRCLNDFGMNRDINLGELSMGEKKKAFMCFALATNTSLLLMDEPSNGFDIPSKSQMQKVIAGGMSENRTIIISTHQVKDIENLLDRVVIIDNGNLLLDKSCSEISEKLLFANQPAVEPTDGAIYTQSTLMGNSIIYPNAYGEESPLNLEMLFNAVLTEREKMQEVLK